MRKYKASKGSQFTDKEAQVYGVELERMAENQEVTPHIVLDEARSDASLLHDYFEWDDSVAADKHRLGQARHLLNHLVVEINVEGGEPIEMKAFFNVDTIPDDERQDVKYVFVERAMSDEDLHAQIVEKAFRELTYWRDKYQQYREFKGVFKAIQKVEVLA